MNEMECVIATAIFAAVVACIWTDGIGRAPKDYNGEDFFD